MDEEITEEKLGEEESKLLELLKEEDEYFYAAYDDGVGYSFFSLTGGRSISDSKQPVSTFRHYSDYHFGPSKRRLLCVPVEGEDEDYIIGVCTRNEVILGDSMYAHIGLTTTNPRLIEEVCGRYLSTDIPGLILRAAQEKNPNNPHTRDIQKILEGNIDYELQPPSNLGLEDDISRFFSELDEQDLTESLRRPFQDNELLLDRNQDDLGKGKFSTEYDEEGNVYEVARLDPNILGWDNREKQLKLQQGLFDKNRFVEIDFSAGLLYLPRSVEAARVLRRTSGGFYRGKERKYFYTFDGAERERFKALENDVLEIDGAIEIGDSSGNKFYLLIGEGSDDSIPSDRQDLTEPRYSKYSVSLNKGGETAFFGTLIPKFNTLVPGTFLGGNFALKCNMASKFSEDPGVISYDLVVRKM